jgi:hypothetical protein
MAKKSLKTHELSALRMPGFNAEASLYASPATYRSSGGLSRAIGAVQPAIGSIQNCFKICGGDPGCEQCCVCTRRGGHPNDCCF